MAKHLFTDPFFMMTNTSYVLQSTLSCTCQSPGLSTFPQFTPHTCSHSPDYIDLLLPAIMLNTSIPALHSLNSQIVLSSLYIPEEPSGSSILQFSACWFSGIDLSVLLDLIFACIFPPGSSLLCHLI